MPPAKNPARQPLSKESHRKESQTPKKAARPPEPTPPPKAAAAPTPRPPPVTGQRHRDDPWKLAKPPTAAREYTHVYRDEATPNQAQRDLPGGQPPPCATIWRRRRIADLTALLKAHGDWLPRGAANEQKPAGRSTVEGLGTPDSKPGRGWVRLKMRLCAADFGMYLRRCGDTSAWWS